MAKNGLEKSIHTLKPMYRWNGPEDSICTERERINHSLMSCSRLCYVLLKNGDLFLSLEGGITPSDTAQQGLECLGFIPPQLPEQLGDPGFSVTYKTKYAYMAGAMANGISGEELVIALGEEGFLASYGTGGLPLSRIEEGIKKIQANLPGGPYVINLLHNMAQPKVEWDTVNLYLKLGITGVEASAFLKLTPALVYYRAKGLARNRSGIIKEHKIIAKISRPEVARQFMQPGPEKILADLERKGLITSEQKELARQVPIADDITVEGDSGGHTDNGNLMCLLPSIMKLRDAMQAKYQYETPIRVGAAGGIGTPHSMWAAFAMGASYVVTGSINQASVEAETSEEVKELLAKVEMSDIIMTPAADMFEMGIKVQVLKKGTFYPMRAQKMYDLYSQYPSIDTLPDKDKDFLEKQCFRQPIGAVWEQTVKFFNERNEPGVIEKALEEPKLKMALIFRWYLGQSSNWAVMGEKVRNTDYQIWCGASMGAFNEWASGTMFEKPENRKAAHIVHALLNGAAYFSRLQFLRGLGVTVSPEFEQYKPGSKGFEETASSRIKEPRPAKQQTVSEQHKMQEQHEMHQSANQPDTQTTPSVKNGKRLTLNKSLNYYEKCWKYYPGGVHYNFNEKDKLMIPFQKGDGSNLVDLDGNRHLDLSCKFGALIVGHNNREFVNRVSSYLEKVTSVDMCDLEVEVGALLTEIIPCAEQVRFGLSGTESVQNAIRLARCYTGKNKFVRFFGHYHGNADNIMGGTLSKDAHNPVPIPCKGDFMETAGRDPHCLPQQSFLIPWNDIPVFEKLVSNSGHEIGAVIMEPICINGGGIMPKSGYLEKIKDVCEKNNILLIFDEIITGFRVGLRGAQGALGVVPHLATYGKAIAGGYFPVSAIVGPREIMDMYRKGKAINAGTFNGYSLGLAAIKATLEMLIEDPQCYDRMGNHMVTIANSLIEAAGSVSLPMVVQGLPNVMIFHSTNTPIEDSQYYSNQIKTNDAIIREICLLHGIQFSPISRLYPTLMINDDDVSFFKSRIEGALKDAASVLAQSGQRVS